MEISTRFVQICLYFCSSPAARRVQNTCIFSAKPKYFKCSPLLMVVEMEDPARADSDVGQPQLAFRVAELDLSLGTVQDVVDNLESAD